MFQIVEQPRPEKMFHEHYPFYSSTSRHMQMHFERFANSVIDTVLDPTSDPFVVELGSNDGTMLRHFKTRGIRHLASSLPSMSPPLRANRASRPSPNLRSRLAERIALEMAMSGPLSDGKGPPTGAGLTVLRVTDIDEARALAEADPFVLNGLRTSQLKEWTIMEGTLGLRVNLSDQSIEVA